MRELRERLQRLGREGKAGAPEELRARLDRLLGAGRVVPAAQIPPPAPGTPAAAVDRFVPGRRRQAPSGPAFVAEWTAPTGYLHGCVPTVELGTLPGPGARALFPEHLGALANASEVAFLDTETTGLAGGAGTVPFLVGVARWVPGRGFRVAQLFLEELDREPALLEALAEELAGVRCLVTYNGRAYDGPLLENRYVLNRRPWPLAGAAHLDLLHPARTLWRRGHPDCRLATLEAGILGHRRVGDVPGAEIPALYYGYLRRGADEGLAAVFRHNRDDLLSLAGLLWAADTARRTPALGLGLLHSRRGRREAAEPFLEAGLREEALPRRERERGLRELLAARKAGGRWDEALEACAELRRLRPTDPFPAVEAAVLLERRRRDPAAALALVENALEGGPWTPADREALERRGERLRQRVRRLRGA
ncbi:MAG: ribonuclease H-like domain-containing protein [Deferrisomatales bacterium]|nr:ribonuclease H-like domain-containing protein [Deferrisomatales bacterium]